MGSSKVLLRTLGWEYYRQQAGFFFVLLGITLGFIRGQDHFHLMMAGLHGAYVLAAYVVLWLLYWMKAVHYTWTALREKQNQFLYQLYLIPKKQQYRLFALLYFAQFAPVILYAGIMAVLGYANSLYSSAAACLLFLLGMLLLSIMLYAYFIRSAGKELPLLSTLANSGRRMHKPSWSLPLFYLLHDQKIALFLSKACSVLLILLVSFLYTSTDYDSRLATMDIGMAALLNAVLIYQIHVFNQIDLSLQRNMPIPLLKRFMHSSACLLMLAIPEVLIFSRHFYATFDMAFLLQAAFLCISIMLLLNSYLLVRPFQKEQFLLHTFFFLVFYYLVTIYHTPLWLTATVGLLLAFLLFYRYYYRFEQALSLDEK